MGELEGHWDRGVYQPIRLKIDLHRRPAQYTRWMCFCRSRYCVHLDCAQVLSIMCLWPLLTSHMPTPNDIDVFRRCDLLPPRPVCQDLINVSKSKVAEMASMLRTVTSALCRSSHHQIHSETIHRSGQRYAKSVRSATGVRSDLRLFSDDIDNSRLSMPMSACMHGTALCSRRNTLLRKLDRPVVRLEPVAQLCSSLLVEGEIQSFRFTPFPRFQLQHVPNDLRCKVPAQCQHSPWHSQPR